MSDSSNSSTFEHKECEVAYFCMEYALSTDFAMYSGGLGVLAADYLYEMDERKENAVAVGLFYSFSYTQEFDQNGEQIEQRQFLSPQELQLESVTSSTGEEVVVKVPIQDRQVKLKCWKKMVGSIPLYLLDTNHPENEQGDRNITDQLYSGDKEHRLLQEMILGIGGVRMLNRLGIFPKKYHMNEGHAGFLSFQVIANLMTAQHISFEEARDKAREMLVFSNHTLIAAGNDAFSLDLVTVYFDGFAREVMIPIHHMLDLGRIHESSLFSMTMLGLRSSAKCNAVSQYHASKAKEIWTNHPLIPVTNGIFLPRWISKEKMEVWPLESESYPDHQMWWNAHQDNKRQLREYVRSLTGKEIPENAVVLTWARRFVEYKRPLALFWQLEWLHHLVHELRCPIHFLFAGKVHPHDTQGKKTIGEVVKLSHSDRFKDSLTFLPNYNLDTAQHLVSGSDVWLNTPMEGYEACGTSGMKAAVNGVLQCTTNDGWVREVSWKDIGWILDNDKISESVYLMIEHEIVPTFTQRDDRDFPVQWVERMIASSQIIRKHYSSRRMVDEYKSQLYS